MLGGCMCVDYTLSALRILMRNQQHCCSVSSVTAKLAIEPLQRQDLAGLGSIAPNLAWQQELITRRRPSRLSTL